jgi:two-component system LytT family response regulator
MLRAIIIDDEESGIETLTILLDRIDRVRVVAKTTEAETGIALIEDYRPDIVFLDISMPFMSGFELIQKLKYRDFKLVFTTAHREYALEAIKNKAYDYLLKPIDIEDLKKCLNNIATDIEPERKTDAERELIEILVKDGIIYLKQKEIVRLEAAGSYTTFYLDNGTKHTASKNLKEYENLLSPSAFYRCHQSHIINLYKVAKFVSNDGFFAQMVNGNLVDISKKNKAVFIEKLKNI